MLSEFPTLPAPLVLSVLRESGGRVITASHRLAELAAEDAARSAPTSRPSAPRPRAPPGFDAPPAPPPDAHGAAAVASASAFSDDPAAALDRLAAGVLDWGPALAPYAAAPAPTSADASFAASTWSTPTRPYGAVLGAGGGGSASPWSPADVAAVWGVRSTEAAGAGTTLTPGRPASIGVPLWTAGNGSGGGGSGLPPPTAPQPSAAAPPSTFDWSSQRAALVADSQDAAVVAATPEEDAQRSRSLPALSPAAGATTWQGANPSATAAAVLDDNSEHAVAAPVAAGGDTLTTDDPATLPPPRLIVIVGLPGAGKSTAAAALASAGWASVDFVDGLTPHLERKERKEVTMRLTGHLLAGRSVVLDGVNALRDTRAHWVEAGKAAGATVHALELRTPLEVCEARTRRGHPDKRPKEADRLVRQWANVLQACRTREGFEGVVMAGTDGDVAAVVAAFGRAACARARPPPRGFPDLTPQRAASLPQAGVSNGASPVAGGSKSYHAPGAAAAVAVAPPPPATAPIPVPPTTPPHDKGKARDDGGGSGSSHDAANGAASAPSSPPSEGDLSAVEFLCSALNLPSAPVEEALAACNGSEAGALDMLMARYAPDAGAPPLRAPAPPTDAAGRLAALFPCVPRATVLSALRAAGGDEADAAGRLCDFLVAGAGGEDNDAPSPVETLASLFPTTPTPDLEAALRAEDGNVDAAAASLADAAERADADARSLELARRLSERSLSSSPPAGGRDDSVPPPPASAAATPAKPARDSLPLTPSKAAATAADDLAAETGAPPTAVLDALAAVDGDVAVARYLLQGDGGSPGDLPPGIAGSADALAHALALEAGETDARALAALRAAGGARDRALDYLTGKAD